MPGLLDHDSSRYADVLGRIGALSRGWRTATTRYDRREALEDIWRELGDDPTHAFPRSMVAHLLADIQADPHEETRWDLESLRVLAPVWEQTSDPRLFDAACRSLPSIYLSLACGARKRGDLDAAREYLRRARVILPVLPASPYTDELTTAIGALERVLRIGTGG
jgi:hypothetical protein